MKRNISLNQKRGFTLIELMIVVAIIGILASVAMPMYQNFVVKSKIGAVLGSVHSLKSAIAVCIHEMAGVVSECSEGSNGVPSFVPTKEIASASVTEGVIVLTLADGIGSGVDGQTITMTPAIGITSLNWNNTTTVTHVAALAEITKQNPPAGS